VNDRRRSSKERELESDAKMESNAVRLSVGGIAAGGPDRIYGLYASVPSGCPRQKPAESCE
jgi:hypothetical protein